MNFLKDKHPGYFCVLGFELNGLVDKGEYLSLEDLYKMAKDETLIDWYKKVKDPNIVGSMSGHKEGSKAFARYREIDEDIKKEVVDML